MAFSQTFISEEEGGEEEEDPWLLFYPRRPEEDANVRAARDLVRALKKNNGRRRRLLGLPEVGELTNCQDGRRDSLDSSRPFDLPQNLQTNHVQRTIAALEERSFSKGLPLAWAMYVSHLSGDSSKRDDTDLVYPTHAVIELLGHCGPNWSLGQYNGEIGVFPNDHVTNRFLVRAIDNVDDFRRPDRYKGDPVLVKGEIFPIIYEESLGRWLGSTATGFGFVNERDVFPLNKADIHDIYSTPANNTGQSLISKGQYEYKSLSARLLGDKRPTKKAELLKKKEADHSREEAEHSNEETEHSKKETVFRLVRISAHNIVQYIRCNQQSIFVELEEYDIEKAPPFSAMSYCWGNQSDQETIFVSGRVLDVPSNLARALRWELSNLLKTSDRPAAVYLWADAICIDQSDIEEKKVQIPLMGRIFKDATQVQLYLGEADEPELVFSMLKELKTRMDEFAGTISGPAMQRLFKDIDFALLTKFVALPAFRRRWVIQEIILSSSLQLRYGRASASWESLMSILEEIQKRCIFSSLVSWDSRHQFSEGTKYLVGLSKLRRRWRPEKPLGFITTLALLREARCQDPRDNVYSLLSLADADWRKTITPDYNATTASDVYVRVAQYAARTSLIKAILSEAGLSKQAWVHTLPSWVPDWSHWIRGDMFPERSLFRCSGYSKISVNLHHHRPYRQNPTINQPAIEGALVDIISAVNCPWPGRETMLREFSNTKPGSHSLGDVNQCYRVHRSFRRLCKIWEKVVAKDLMESGRPYVTGEEVTVAMWQTLLCGQLDRRRKLRAEDKCLYEAFLNGKKRLLHLAKSGKIATSQDQNLSDEGNLQMVQQDNGMRFVSNMRDVQEGSCLCITGAGRYGTIPNEAAVGDLVAVFSGFEVPFIIRPGMKVTFDRASKRPLPLEYLLVGPAYIHGIMDGELVVNRSIGNIARDGINDKLRIRGADTTEIVLM